MSGLCINCKAIVSTEKNRKVDEGNPGRIPLEFFKNSDTLPLFITTFCVPLYQGI